jgi:hypothetical protein
MFLNHLPQNSAKRAGLFNAKKFSTQRSMALQESIREIFFKMSPQNRIRLLLHAKIDVSNRFGKKILNFSVILMTAFGHVLGQKSKISPAN